MPELIYAHPNLLSDQTGTKYAVRIYADRRTDGTWEGWLEFVPANSTGLVLRTEQETSQPTRAGVEYWALGLEPVYLDGALSRARSRAADQAIDKAS